MFDIEKLLWKSEFCNFAGLITSTKNVQIFFQSHFCDQWSLKSFYQIPLTWSKYYPYWETKCYLTDSHNLLWRFDLLPITYFISSLKNFVDFLVDVKTPKSPFEINWSLVVIELYLRK